MKIAIATGLLTTLLAGCAVTGNTPERRAELAATAPKCYTDKDCEIMWSAARRWVLSNAGMKLQIVTADFMETYNPLPNSSKLAVRVTKEPMREGGYRIAVVTWCDNLIGCVPDNWDAALAFNREVSASVR